MKNWLPTSLFVAFSLSSHFLLPSSFSLFLFSAFPLFPILVNPLLALALAILAHFDHSYLLASRLFLILHH